MPEQIDPEKLEEQLRLTREALAVLRELVGLQGQRIQNLEDWVKRLEQKVRIGF